VPPAHRHALADVGRALSTTGRFASEPKMMSSCSGLYLFCSPRVPSHKLPDWSQPLPKGLPHSSWVVAGCQPGSALVKNTLSLLGPCDLPGRAQGSLSASFQPTERKKRPAVHRLSLSRITANTGKPPGAVTPIGCAAFRPHRKDSVAQA
jgi:hypothetical protein